MKPIRFRPEARADVLEIQRWHEDQRPGLGSELRDELASAIEAIRGSPHSTRSGGMSHPPSPRKSAVFRGSPPSIALRAAAGKDANSPSLAVSVLLDT
jgi:plasmid stabilization system protein ParE